MARSYLLDVVTGANIHDDMFQIAKLPRNVQRVREGHQDGVVLWERQSLDLTFENQTATHSCYSASLLPHCLCMT